MSVIIISRPLGHKLSDTVLDGSISNSAGEALVTTLFSHALTTGDYVYIQSNFDSYNGYKYVSVVSVTTFKIFDSPDLNAISYVQDADITYQVSVLEHGVQAVYNPIVYDLKSNLYPINEPEEAYTPTTVSSQQNDNGYTKLILSGNLTDATALAWIYINDIAYQIISVVSDSIVTINLAYDAGNSFPGPVVKYYNNYRINIDVYAGLAVGHPWADKKPYQLMATISFIPDSNARVKFSISDLIRSYIFTRNNLTLDTLPNNIDFAAQFCIEYFESWDESDGLTVSTHTESTVSDCSNFQGLAINAMMPFKNQSLNFMSDYISEDVYLARWLVLQDRLIGIVGKFMDISFINIIDFEQDIEIRQNGIAIQTISNPGLGILRVPLNFDAAGEYCIDAWIPEIPAEPGFPITLIFMFNCDGATWITGASPQVTLTPLDESGYLYRTFTAFANVEYSFTYDITVNVSPGSPITSIRIAILDGDCNVLASAFESGLGTSLNGTLSVTSPVNGTRVGIQITNLTLSDSKTYVLNSLDFDGSPVRPAQQITESICIDVVDECDDTIIPDMDDMRLLEDGNFRLLE